MEVKERLLKYISIKTPCDENSDKVPTTSCQFNLAKILADELKDLGLTKVILDDKCFVYGILPATPGYETRKKLGFIAHMDTVQEFCEGEIHPVCTPDYNGEDLVLGDSGRILTTKDFPHLKALKGRTLITSDGNTILGVDDKAGIAEIMQLLEILQTEQIPHGQISVAFTPDEECGSGAAHFDFEAFDAEVAYTMDGDGEGEIQYQNFNACEAKFEINGKNVHPGSAKNVMINAVLIAADINNMLPRYEIPRYTEEYEGFYHLLSIHGDEGYAIAEYIIRDHDTDSFEARKNTLRHIEKTLNELWGAGTVALTLTDEYKNMECIIKEHMYLIDYARQACANANVPEDISPIRGGTDGCKLSFKGLPCPNLGTGGHGYHGPLEHVTIEGMEAAVRVIVELVKIFANE
ncbi:MULTISPECIES: peptidase T [Coprococcus]|uniref:Peptidase T n=1 Tax=Coprococcus comes TaxID=410072 RepID=A0A3R6E1L3_9FIRM|nr:MULTISPECIES: peptidase T [Coprococcus]RHG62456.1 peptidase T [Coprococcus comes]